jgi:hypothetical protein
VNYQTLRSIEVQYVHRIIWLSVYTDRKPLIYCRPHRYTLELKRKVLLIFAKSENWATLPENVCEICYIYESVGFPKNFREIERIFKFCIYYTENVIFLRKYSNPKIVLSFLSCSGHPVLSVRSSQVDLSTSTRLGCPNPVVLYLTSCHGCLVPGAPSPPAVPPRMSCPSCLVPAVLSRLFCPSCPVPAVLSRVSFFGLKKLFVSIFWLSYFHYLIPAVLYQPPYPGIFVRPHCPGLMPYPDCPAGCPVQVDKGCPYVAD